MWDWINIIGEGISPEKQCSGAIRGVRPFPPLPGDPHVCLVHPRLRPLAPAASQRPPLSFVSRLFHSPGFLPQHGSAGAPCLYTARTGIYTETIGAGKKKMKRTNAGKRFPTSPEPSVSVPLCVRGEPGAAACSTSLLQPLPLLLLPLTGLHCLSSVTAFVRGWDLAGLFLFSSPPRNTPRQTTPPPRHCAVRSSLSFLCCWAASFFFFFFPLSVYVGRGIVRRALL